MFNGIRETQEIPTFMKLSNITSIFKNKGSRANLDNERGIFIQTVFKKILEKLIYNDNYSSIDLNMSDSNIGARKSRNIRDHLFVLYAVINSINRGKSNSIDLQIYDIEKCFDSLWLEDCLNDLHDTLPVDKRNDKISLLYKLNETNLVSVKSPIGASQRINMPFIVQQGGTWGSLLCANTIDTLGKECSKFGNFTYKYKGITEILPLAFIDDLNGISDCGRKSLELNVYITSKIELKKLKFGKNKCFKMHVGKRNDMCPSLKVHGETMAEVSEVFYLGNIISADGKNTKNIKDRTAKGIGLISQIFNILNSVSFGSYTFQISLLLRNLILVNGMLTNAETWYNLTAAELKDFEKIDRLFFMKLFEVPRSTPMIAFYLETGSLPLWVMIKVRRLIYLHTILRSPKTGMLYRVFIIQWKFPAPGDWILQVRDDLMDFDLPSDLEWLSRKSANVFKTLVKKKARLFAFQELESKKETYKKLKSLKYSELKVENYLMDEKFRYDEKKTLFQFRTRMAKFGNNFKSGKILTICPLCKLHFDDQSLCLKCPKIRKQIECDIDISDLFTENISSKTAKVLSEVVNIRAKLKNNEEHLTVPAM